MVVKIFNMEMEGIEPIDDLKDAGIIIKGVECFITLVTL